MFRIETNYVVDGRTVSPDEFGSALEKAVVEKAIEHIEGRLTSVSCPEHHRRPTVTVSRGTAGKIEFKVSGCCQALIEEATKSLQ